MITDILSVSALNQAVRTLLESHFTQVWVEGEISNLVRPGSGHLYFSLKDANAQVRCAFFRRQSARLSFEPQNGQHVKILARVSVYPERGDYQLIVEDMEASGAGALKRAYELLVQELAAQGLFQAQWKKPIPYLPRAIGLITSPTGAAIRDILSVLKRRFPSIPIFIYPTKVQGNEAASEIVQALARANHHQQCDVLILSRGGGSLEDLWPFNEEKVARALFASLIPVISGVGHEIDFTIADLVADIRAATPSAAAELASPNQVSILQQLSVLLKRLVALTTTVLQHRSQQVDWLSKRLRHPGHALIMQRERINMLQSRISQTMKRILKEKNQSLNAQGTLLAAVSPLATLGRGYAIISKPATGAVIRSIHELALGAKLRVRLQDGTLDCEVKGKG